MPLVMTWWMWLLLGLGLAALELVTPGGFFILFFGAGAMVVGILEWIGVPLSLPVQVVVFLAVSVVSLLVFRKPMQRRFAHSAPSGVVDSLVGEEAQVIEEIPAGGIGKVELRGSAWNARNAGDGPIPRLTRCTVERVDGLTLFVRA